MAKNKLCECCGKNEIYPGFRKLCYDCWKNPPDEDGFEITKFTSPVESAFVKDLVENKVDFDGMTITDSFMRKKRK